MKTLEMASDVIAGSTTFAGLIIVYLGSVSTAYGGYSKVEQRTVRPQFRRRASFACAGIVLAGLAALLALLGKWAASRGMVGISVILLAITLAWGIGTSIQTVREIR